VKESEERRLPACAPFACAAIFLLLLAPTTFAQVLTSTPRGIVVAHDGRVELAGGWNTAGVKTATSIVAGTDQVAVLDALNNEAVIVDLATGRTTRQETAETPIDAAFLGRDLYVLARDAQQIERFGPPASSPAGTAASRRRAGGTPALRTDPDPAFLRAFNRTLYVYSRATGTVQQLGGPHVAIAPFASDFEIANNTGYLVYPREALIRTVDLRTMKKTGEIKVGAVPVDLAFAGGGTAITARVLAVADPSAKRVWLTEGTQSTGQAIARGFLRGLLGLGLFGARASQFPTGVDRVVISGKTWVAYDTSTGTLYRFTKSKSSILAKGVAPHAFAVTSEGVVAWWHDGRVRLAR
jgi:hypothetical protein